MIRRSVPDPEETHRQGSHALNEPPVLTEGQHRIIHSDTDAFFASVEQRPEP
jgi:hypothetical protein